MGQVGLVVPLLVVPNPLQSSDRIENRPGQHTGQQQANLVDGQSGCEMLRTDTQANQEMMRQSDQQHVMVPTDPTAHFVVIETDFALRFFENGFDRPTHAADADEFDHGGFGGCVTEVELNLGRIIKIAAQDQPDFRTWQVIARFSDAQESNCLLYTSRCV